MKGLGRTSLAFWFGAPVLFRQEISVCLIEFKAGHVYKVNKNERV
jgi:hypothetical protein